MDEIIIFEAWTLRTGSHLKFTSLVLGSMSISKEFNLKKIGISLEGNPTMVVDK